MAKKLATLAERIREISRQLEAISRELLRKKTLANTVVDEAPIASAAKELLDQGRCVQCGDVFEAGERVRFGLDSKCYQRTIRKYGTNRWNELIAMGIAAPGKPPGRRRKRTRLDEVEEQVKEMQSTATEQAAKKNAKTKGDL